MLITTLTEIRAASPCKSGWETLLTHLGKTAPDDEPLPVSTVLAANGIADALWVLSRACGEAGRAICVKFAADCAERVLPIWEAAYPDDTRPRAAVEAARSGDAAYAAADAAYAADAAAAYAAYAAAYAADADAERAWQAARLREMIEGAE